MVSHTQADEIRVANHAVQEQFCMTKDIARPMSMHAVGIDEGIVLDACHVVIQERDVPNDDNTETLALDAAVLRCFLAATSFTDGSLSRRLSCLITCSMSVSGLYSWS